VRTGANRSSDATAPPRFARSFLRPLIVSPAMLSTWSAGQPVSIAEKIVAGGSGVMRVNLPDAPTEAESGPLTNVAPALAPTSSV
jgi:hypothetical protein